ncbi:ribosomal protein L7Ae-like RNA K-turn-binding protein [Desulfohalotomaculum tongense]|nr:ribosomal L7Ae/L30e/S12e/Gadd45 family protein [Desulforadius tongensis]MBM7854438.1 ribosomal protein L7Ae-like RNA K-turn-binding protein [Desulforadius tongensis]
MNKQTANLLGLCQRAGKLLSGDAQVKNSIKERKAVLVLLAADASERTKKEYYHLAKANSIPIIETGTKLELGWSAGKSPRAALAVSDENFARGITEIIERGEA